MTTQPKTERPTDADLKGNPGIGLSRGTTAAGVSADELEADLGDTTIEGDIANDTNPASGIDKADADRGPKDRP